MRAGDYPVKSTQYVGVIIVLAGLGNVPRVRELDEIRTIYENEQGKEYKKEEKTETIQTVQIANDEILFEDEMVMPIRVSSTSVPTKNKDDIFELDNFSENQNEEGAYQEGSQVIQSLPDPQDDASEDVIKRVVPSAPHQQQYMHLSEHSSQCIRQTPTSTISEDFQSENRSKNVIDAPKKQKKYDNVLAGIANIGNKNKPKDSDNVLSGKANVGSQRPRETMVPDVLEGTVSIGTQRPKETDGYIKIESFQRPKEAAEPVCGEGTQRPKEIDGTAKIRNAQRPREINKNIQVTKIPLPKNPSVRNIAKKSENDKSL
jgi:hypothetical protein